MSSDETPDSTEGALGQIQVGSLSFTHLIIIGAVYSLVVIFILFCSHQNQEIVKIFFVTPDTNNII